MPGLLLLAAFVLLAPQAAVAPNPGVLRITIVVHDADDRPTPAARHALLISDNPATSTPRRVVTGVDGTAELRLPPGNYTVESEQPYPHAGNAYEWVETLDVRSGAAVTLALSDRNAERVPLTDAVAAAAAPRSAALAERLPAWQGSVVALWTPRLRASGFVIDAAGLVATSHHAVGATGTVDVQVSPTVTVEGRVVAVDATHDVAVVWVDPSVVSGMPPAPLVCGQPQPRPAGDADVVALGVPLRQQQDRLIRGRVSRVTDHAIDIDIRLPPGAAGGPLLTPDGTLIGITAVDDSAAASRREARAIPIADACDVVSVARMKLQGAMPPSAARRPLEPATPFPAAALQDALTRRAGNLAPYRMSASEFDVAFITPLMVYASQQPDRRTTSRDTRSAAVDQMRIPSWSDFAGWADYVANLPPVLLIRVTPRLSEGFWTTVARGAAMTQGVNLPAMKRFRSTPSGMRAFCGDREVPPIHAFVLESKLVETETVVERLYAFDPGAFNPECRSVTLRLYGDDDPERGDAKTVEPAVVRQIWDDFAPHREP